MAILNASVLLIAEMPLDRLPPGKRFRVESLEAWLIDRGFHPEIVSLGDARRDNKLNRFFAGLHTGRIEKIADALSVRSILIAGFGAPHLLILARRLARKYQVVFDTCDSWILQAEARISAGTVSSLPSHAGAWIQSRTRQIHIFTYISGRDAMADSSLVPAASMRVIPPKSQPELLALTPSEPPLSRVVIAADLTSFHNREFFEEHADELQRAYELGLIPQISVFGPIAPDFKLRPVFSHSGWAQSRVEIYDGNTGVIITNSPGSGVPTKLVEAFDAGRPVVVPANLKYAARTPRAAVYWWDARRSLTSAIISMIEGDQTEYSFSEEESWPLLSKGDLISKFG